MMTLREEATARAPGASDRLGQGAGLGPRGMRVELGIVPVERRAVWADNFVVLAHVEEHVRMIERRSRADAHELAGADFDDGDARIVVKMWNDVVGHDSLAFLAVVRGTIAGRGPIS